MMQMRLILEADILVMLHRFRGAGLAQCNAAVDAERGSRQAKMQLHQYLRIIASG
jgi:hypothetical protein